MWANSKPGVTPADGSTSLDDSQGAHGTEGATSHLPKGDHTIPNIGMSWHINIICHQPVNFFLVSGVISREIMNVVLCSFVLWYEAKEFWGGQRGVWYERVLVEVARFLVFFFLGGVLLGEVAIKGDGLLDQETFNWILRGIGFYS